MQKSPSTRRKKEIKVLTVIGTVLMSLLVYFNYIRYIPICFKGFPIIKINFEGDLDYEEYIDCTFEVDNCKDSNKIEQIDSKIRLRGSGLGWNKISPKKGYRIELKEPKSLLGMREDDDWLLFSLYFDYPRMRIKLAMELWRSLLYTDPTAILPNSEYVCLYLNGEFRGLYLLAEKNDRRLFNLENCQNNVNSSLIFQVKHETDLNYYDKDVWEQDWPNEYEGIYIMDAVLYDLINFIHQPSIEVFFNCKNGIYSKFNKQNLVDFFIFNFFIDHQDFWNHNYFIVRNTYPSKFFLIPWDFDRSLGGYIWDTYDSDRNPESEIVKINALYHRLLNNFSFREDCKNRWFELREIIWTEDQILNILEEIYDDIKQVLEIDVDLWNSREPISFREDKKNNIQNSVSHLFNWIPERLEFCDLYFYNM
ncbi:MAG: CotH kinase family protein [Candidatus Hodarchaeota archaeon]